MIDIIIPAYNAQKSIIKTLHSIAMQTIRDKFNVYIIDDCSQNNYNDVVKLFKKWLNIKCLRLKENVGPGLARQYGIDNSDGDYIVFVDSDDLLFDCFSIENLYKRIIEDDYDMAIGIFVDEEDGQYFSYTNHQGCLHGKMYKRKFIEENNLKFNETRSSEDNAFNRLYLLANPRRIYVNDYIYMYKDNKNSITKTDSENYQWYSTEFYIQNMVWVTKEAELRNIDIHMIACHVFESYLYVYYIYLLNMYRCDANLIFIWIKELHQIYLEYNKFLSEQEKYNLYCDYMYFIDYEKNLPNFRLMQIPKMSLREFINQVDLYS